MLRYFLLYLSVLGLLFFNACGQPGKTVKIASPSGKLAAYVSINEQDQLVYRVQQNEKTIIDSSRLGIIREDADFSTGLSITNISNAKRIEDSYTLKVHKKEKYKYTAIEKSVTVKNGTGEKMRVIFRVSDHGVAFRYYFPEHSNDAVKHISNELTSFAFHEDTRAWLQPIAHAKTSWGNTNPSYEENYHQNIPVGTPSPYAGWVYPALFKTGDTWVLISESAVDRHYCATRLHAESPGGEYSIDFPEEEEVVFTGELNPQSTLPWYTPWRIIAIGSLGDIVASSLGTDLAKPAIEGDFSWVEPGRSSWSWVMLKDDYTIFPVQKEFIDYSAEMGWEYCLVDGFWDTQIGYDSIQALVDYARSNDVKINLWYNSAGDWNTTPITPKSALLTDEQRNNEFTRIKKMGVAGIKIDFFGGDGQSVMNHYIDIFEQTAAHKLVVNCHGSTLPRGWHRTYPNLMTMESVKGMEFATFAQDAADSVPSHCTILPFTRNVFSPMDFTPTTFGETPNINRITSNAFELALPVLFQSGIQNYAVIPEVMEQMPNYVKQLMKDIPVVWDETKLVEGFPGEYVVMARRSDSTWYVAGINGKNNTRNLSLDLSFIKSLDAMLVTDGENNRSFQKSEIQIPGEGHVNIELKPRGGFVIQVKG